MAASVSLPQVQPQREQQLTLPSFEETFGSRIYPLSPTSSQSSFQTVYQADNPPTPRTFSCPTCSLDGEYVSVSMGDTCLRCHTTPNPTMSRRFINYSNLDAVFVTAVADDESVALPQVLGDSDPIAVRPHGNTPFRASSDPPLRSRTQSGRRPYRTTKDPSRVSKRHCDKEKWRRDIIAANINTMRSVKSVMLWPGVLVNCQVKVCSSLRNLIESCSSINNPPRPSCAQLSSIGAPAPPQKNPKDAVLFNSVLLLFSVVLHYQAAETHLIIENQEKLLDRSLEKKARDMSQNATRAQGERDITAKTEYGVLCYMLEQCRGHEIVLDEGIAGRQEDRRIRLGIEGEITAAGGLSDGE